MRVAVVAPVARPVVPDSTSSIELLCWLLAEELVRRGHHVTLFATGDSKTSAALCSTYERGYCHDGRLWSWELHEALHMAAVFERAERFDVIHSHASHFALPFSSLTSRPVLHTYHVNPGPDIVDAYRRQPRARVVAVSEYHRRKFAGVGDVAVVPNGIDPGSFPFGPRPGKYLLFLGHLIARKGPLEAIRVARLAGMPLVMAGSGGEYFDAQVAPLVDGRSVHYVGPVGTIERNRLLAGAAALVFTSTCAEPFGLVLVEAMACGTPVAALRRCAVAEIVEPSVTGYHAPDAGSLAARLPDVVALDRGRVRRAASAFHYHRMVDGYEALYARAVHDRREREALVP